MHVCERQRQLVHAYIWKPKRLRVHVCMQRCISNMQVHMNTTCKAAYAHASIHICIHTYSCMHAHSNSCVHAYSITFTRMHIAYMYIQTHACMHTQSRTHACVQRHFLCKSFHRIVSANLHTGVLCSTSKVHTNAHSSVVSTFPRGAQNGNSQDHLKYNVQM